jgi:hypothetical protein
MSFLVGFIIALAVGLTGVGAGSVTAPVLILFFGLKPSESVGTALLFAAAIKLAVAPIYLARRQVNRRVLLLLCAGGIPGVIAGVAIIHALDVRRYENVLFFLLGTTIMAMALYSLYRSTRKAAESANRERLGWLPWIAGGIGAEVGFSSAGAGARTAESDPSYGCGSRRDGYVVRSGPLSRGRRLAFFHRPLYFRSSLEINRRRTPRCFRRSGLVHNNPVAPFADRAVDLVDLSGRATMLEGTVVGWPLACVEGSVSPRGVPFWESKFRKKTEKSSKTRKTRADKPISSELRAAAVKRYG